MSESSESNNEQTAGWIESDNLDCQISEACQLYCIDSLECAHDMVIKKESDDLDSIVSDDSVKDEVSLQDRVNSRLHIVRETESGQTLWKCPIRESDTIADHIAAVKQLSHRLPCHSFRSMLPPLIEGERLPVPSPVWLRYCTRGVLFAALRRYSENHECNQNNPMDRLRFPEHVYCWLADGDKRTPDEDRWVFYDGVKCLADSNPECWLVYNLLNDMQGEDFFTFLAHSVAIVRKQTGKAWELQFPEVLSYRKAIESESQLMDALQQSGSSFEDDGVCSSNIWIPVEICNDAINQLFGWIKSSENLEEICSTLNQVAADIENTLLWGEQAVKSQDEPTTDTVTPSIDLFTFLQMIMQTYISHRKKQLVHIRLMFETASKGVLTDFYGTAQESKPSNQEDLVTVPQLHQILRTIWPPITLSETTLIYREAYDALYPPSQWSEPAPDGINFKSFLVAAERRSLFTRVRST